MPRNPRIYLNQTRKERQRTAATPAPVDRNRPGRRRHGWERAHWRARPECHQCVHLMQLPPMSHLQRGIGGLGRVKTLGRHKRRDKDKAGINPCRR